MMTTHSYLPGDILVVEQAAMVGGIIVPTARELKMPRVRLATSSGSPSSCWNTKWSAA